MHDSKPRTTDGQIYESRKDTSGHASTKREWTLQTHSAHDEISNHRKYMRVQSSSSNRVASNSSSSASQRQNGDKKTGKDTKKPLRVVGDWSEFKSSTEIGKTYFYNSKTEVSQWEKPKGWPKDESSSHRSSATSTSSSDRTKRESIPPSSSTVRSRPKVEASPPVEKKPSHPPRHQNGTHHSHRSGEESVQSTEQIVNHRLATPDDDSSRMSFSSTSSKESSSIVNHPNETNGATLHTSFSEPGRLNSAVPVSTPIPILPPKPFEATSTPTNGHGSRHSINRAISSVNGSTTSPQREPATVKAEREQEIQKFYRAELIQHLIDWPSTQSEKLCLKLFDEYYGHSAKISTAFTELKGLKSNIRVINIKRDVLTHKLFRYQQLTKERGENKPS